MKSQAKIAVIGAGVVGLSTAVCLQKEFPSSNVTIIADKVCDDTLSAGAGGLYRPEINIDHNINRLKYVNSFKSVRYHRIFIKYCFLGLRENLMRIKGKWDLRNGKFLWAPNTGKRYKCGSDLISCCF